MTPREFYNEDRKRELAECEQETKQVKENEKCLAYQKKKR